MSKFYSGDVVQFGTRGTVHYEVFFATEETANVQSLKSGQNKYEVPNEKLVLVEGGPARHAATAEKLNPTKVDAEELGKVTKEFVDATGLVAEVTQAEIQQNTRTQRGTAEAKKASGNRRTQSEEEAAQIDHRKSSYGKAILRALNTLGKHVYSGTAKDKPARKAKRLAKAARRQTRKAGRA